MMTKVFGNLLTISVNILHLIFITTHLSVIVGQHCDPACQANIEEAKDYAAGLHSQTNAITDDLLRRVMHLENHQHDAEHLWANIQAVEKHLEGNVTDIQNRITDIYNYLNAEITKVDQKIPKVPNTGDQTAALRNLEGKLVNLLTVEQKNIKNLTDDNKMWRENFRKINATFAKLKQKKIV